MDPLIEMQKEIVKLQKERGDLEMEVDLLSKVVKADKTFDWAVLIFGIIIGCVATYFAK